MVWCLLLGEAAAAAMGGMCWSAQVFRFKLYEVPQESRRLFTSPVGAADAVAHQCVAALKASTASCLRPKIVFFSPGT